MKLSVFFILLFFILSQNLYSSISKNTYKAVKSGNLKKIKYLVNKKNVNNLNSDGETIINYAIISGNLKTVKYLIKIGANINNKAKIKYNFIIKNKKVKKIIKTKEENTKYGDTPLIIAIKTGDEEIVSLLIEKGAIINLKNNHSNIPINISVKKNNIPITKYLIKKGAKVNPEHDSWNVPLILGIRNDNLEMVKLLVENGADINRKESVYMKPIKIAVLDFDFTDKFTDQRLEIIKYLVKKGAVLDDNILYLAVKANSVKLIKFLLENGAKLKLNDKYGDTPYELAAEKGYLGILKKLFATKKNKEIINKSFFKAVGKKNNEEMINYLISLNADINYIDDKTGKNILIRAIEKNNINLVKLIVKKSANVNFISKHGYTPLMASINNYEIIKYLINNKAKVNLYNPKYSQNLLSYAISMGDDNNVIKLLIKKRANTKNALYNASIKFNNEIVELLLTKNIKINKKYKGETPLTATVKYATYNMRDFNRKPNIKKTLTILISKGGEINKKYLESKDIKSHKKLYAFIKSEMKKYTK